MPSQLSAEAMAPSARLNAILELQIAGERNWAFDTAAVTASSMTTITITVRNRRRTPAVHVFAFERSSEVSSGFSFADLHDQREHRRWCRRSRDRAVGIGLAHVYAAVLTLPGSSVVLRARSQRRTAVTFVHSEAGTVDAS